MHMAFSGCSSRPSCSVTDSLCTVPVPEDILQPSGVADTVWETIRMTPLYFQTISDQIPTSSLAYKIALYFQCSPSLAGLKFPLSFSGTKRLNLRLLILAIGHKYYESHGKFLGLLSLQIATLLKQFLMQITRKGVILLQLVECLPNWSVPVGHSC
jgi:hypothetical protein